MQSVVAMSNRKQFCRIFRSFYLPAEKCRLLRKTRAFHACCNKNYASESSSVDDGVEKKVLLDLNCLTEKELSKFKHLGKDKAERISSYKKQHGQIQSIEELENIHGFTSSIIKSLKKDGLVERKLSSYVHVLTEEQASKIKSFTSINIGRREIVWCSLSTKYTILDWKSMELKREKQYKPKIFIENVMHIVQQIPVTDLNIVELQSYKSASKNPSVFPNVLHKRLAEAVIHAVSPVQTLSFDPNLVKKHFSLPKSLNKHYYSMTVVNDLLTETMKNFAINEDSDVDLTTDDEEDHLEGGKEIVHSILDNSRNSQSLLNISQSLQVPEKCIHSFHDAKQKDCLSDALLQALTFLQLEILGNKGE